MNLTRIYGSFALAAAFALSACSGGGPATEATAAVAPTSSASAYTGPAPATADVQAFAVSFWNNVRVQNRCGQCHNATSPAQMPNFARSDDVNLAYAQANTVVNLQQPSTSMIVTKVSGGHNCWLSDPNACGQILTTWISNWAGASGSGTGTQVQLQAPPLQTVGQSRNFPASPNDFSTTVYPLLQNYCAKCHSPNASTPQSPYFASSDVNQAYLAAIPKMDLNTPANSRFYERLLNENHNCWSKCSDNAATMLAAIQAFANLEPLTSVDPSLVTSSALGLTQGTVASGANRFDTNVIAKYEFQTGTGLTAFDTSGVDPSADLTLSGSVSWAGGWGILIQAAGGKAQASTSSSKKIHDLIEATGEYSVEAWVAPALVAADKSYMVSYSGGDTVRNFTLGQTNQQYDFMMRDSNTDLNGVAQVQTPMAAMLLQASLQHVVLTYDPVNGRQIYVNGVNSGAVDAEKGGTMGNWDDTFALVLGNEVSSDRPWQGLIKFVAIHDRALTAAQITQNFNAGVGQRFYLLFNVAQVTGVSKGYVMMTVSQYDNASYLFTKPTFISLDPTVTPDNVVVKGIRIGINGTIPTVGQAYIPLNTTVTAANYTAQGEVLSNIGTVIAIQSGPLVDQFFLSFDQLGSATHVTTEPTPVSAAPVDLAPVATIGVRTFAQINSSLSALTGVPTTQSAVFSTYQTVQQQLPSAATLESFSSANQVGIAQLAIQYCNVAVNTPSLAAQLLPGVTLNASTYSTQAGIDSVTSALAARVLGTGLTAQPAASTMTGASGELDQLIGTLCTTTACNTSARVLAVTAAACAAALGSSDMLIN
ncbi:MAG TPA: LamG domain-containing protein [Steroidobacteraceae bacterium]|nr:LamG domain-containing protein [Steroidobacteraceae bacterium]